MLHKFSFTMTHLLFKCQLWLQASKQSSFHKIAIGGDSVIAKEELAVGHPSVFVSQSSIQYAPRGKKQHLISGRDLKLSRNYRVKMTRNSFSYQNTSWCD